MVKQQEDFMETWKWHVVDGVSPSTEENGLTMTKKLLSRIQLTNPTDASVVSSFVSQI